MLLQRLGHVSATVNFIVVTKRKPFVHINHKIFTMSTDSEGRRRHKFSLSIDERTRRIIICLRVYAAACNPYIFMYMYISTPPLLQISHFFSHRPPCRQIYHINIIAVDHFGR